VFAKLRYEFYSAAAASFFPTFAAFGFSNGAR
jgi:hypothetical protein